MQAYRKRLAGLPVQKFARLLRLHSAVEVTLRLHAWRKAAERRKDRRA